jgi:hypothetical protein
MPRLTIASLIIADHPYFEDRVGRHCHLVACWNCLTITLETGDLRTCQTCQEQLYALELDLLLHLGDGSFDPRG